METLRELANLSAGALVLGQFVGQQSSSLWSIVAGAALRVGLVAGALVFAGGNDG